MVFKPFPYLLVHRLDVLFARTDQQTLHALIRPSYLVCDMPFPIRRLNLYPPLSVSLYQRPTSTYRPSCPVQPDDHMSLTVQQPDPAHANYSLAYFM